MTKNWCYEYMYVCPFPLKSLKSEIFKHLTYRYSSIIKYENMDFKNLKFQSICPFYKVSQKAPTFILSCMKVLTLLPAPSTKGGRLRRPSSMISKTVQSTNFNFGMRLGLSIRDGKPVELMT